MPMWEGGPCPDCGDEMPARLIHCQTCGALLNSDLRPKTVKLPDFVPLKEVERMVEVKPIGFYVDCPHCSRELRIHGKYLGQRVQCKFCHKPFDFQSGPRNVGFIAFYTNCPHCKKEIRAARKYLGEKVACKLCNGALQFVY